MLWKKSQIQKKINLEKYSDDWLSTIIRGALICDFKTKKLFYSYITEMLKKKN
jgi:hypothetical protein